LPTLVDEKGRGETIEGKMAEKTTQTPGDWNVRAIKEKTGEMIEYVVVAERILDWHRRHDIRGRKGAPGVTLAKMIAAYHRLGYKGDRNITYFKDETPDETVVETGAFIYACLDGWKFEAWQDDEDKRRILTTLSLLN